MNSEEFSDKYMSETFYFHVYCINIVHFINNKHTYFSIVRTEIRTSIARKLIRIRIRIRAVFTIILADVYQRRGLISVIYRFFK